MHVGTFSGVKSPGMVISSALGGTSKGNSSLTNDKIKDVLPTFLQKSQKNLLKHIFIHLVSQFDTILKNHSYLSPMSRIRTSLRLRMPMIYLAVIIKWRKNRENREKRLRIKYLVQIFRLEKKSKINVLLSPGSTNLSLVRYILLVTLKLHQMAQ